MRDDTKKRLCSRLAVVRSEMEVVTVVDFTFGSHFTVGVTRRLLLSTRVSSLVDDNNNRRVTPSVKCESSHI